MIEKAVVILSGGLDSTTLLNHLRSLKYEIERAVGGFPSQWSRRLSGCALIDSIL
jgi:hypothetical protein